MPWAIKVENGKHCVYKKTTGKVMHCYDSEEPAKKYLAALHMHASEKELEPGLFISKEDDGRYKIVAVSTAAMKDREGETFDVEAIDYDIALAKQTKQYPEFRLFHKKHVAVGKVENMRRAGIFAIDEGHSYTDPFSLSVCKEMLAENDGTWKVSRGFYVIEASGTCPNCSESLLVGTKHMVTGFKCPRCKSVHVGRRGVLKDMHFRKAKTFDVTITDNPAVPWTGVTAFKDFTDYPEVLMNKKQLKEKLLAAGVDETAVEEKLAGLTDEQLKEYSDIPFAEVLKELKVDKSEDEDADVEVFTLDEESLKEFGSIVEKTLETLLEKKLGAIIKKEVAAAIEGLEIDVADMKDLEVDFKEMPEFQELLTIIKELDGKVDKLTESEDKRLKELLDETPRSGKLRIRRYKVAKPDDEEDVEEDDEENEDEDMPMMKKKKQSGVSIVSGDGKRAASMTEFVLGS